MSAIDRAALLEELSRLSDDDDAVVLAAARAAQALVDEVDGGWSAVFPASGAEKSAPTKKRAKTPTSGDVGAVIAALLDRADLSEDARGDLVAFQAAQADGDLDAQDEAYVRALAARLG